MKHRYIAFITSGLLVVSVALAPAAAFAAGNAPMQDHGFFSEFTSWFHIGTRIAHADSTTTANNLPPVISGVSSPTVLTVGQSGTWSVSASDPQNGNLTYSVDWGDTGLLHALFAGASAFVQTSTFTHTYASPGTYTVKFAVKDSAGLTSTSSVTVQVNAATAPAPIITNVNATSSSQTRATVMWTTNVRSNSTVYYSTTNPVATSSAQSVTKTGEVLNHKVTLTKLSAGTTYYFVVESQTNAGGMTTSAQGSFTTKSAASTGPTISSVNGPQTIAADTQGTWAVMASDPSNSTLSYAINWGDNAPTPLMAANARAITQTTTFSHTYASAGTYTITVTATDAAGLSTTATTTVTVTPATVTTPTISGITALVKENDVVFNWNTSEAADSEVYYSTSSTVTPGAASTQEASDATLGTSHSVDVGSLSSGTMYNFLIESQDATGNIGSSTQFSLTTMSM